VSKDIAVPATSGVEQLTAIVNSVHMLALRAARKALLEKEEDGYDGSGDKPWAFASTRVRIGVMLASKAMDHVRETDVGHRQFGLLVLRERIKDVREWEKHAATVDAAPAPTRTTTMDAEIIEPLKVEGK
jgi:hypothetical protein